MSDSGIHLPLLVAQLVNLALLTAWVILAILALRRMRAAALPATAQAIWAALIVLVPLLGALAFLLTRPTRN